jgi:hypothetical protein
MLFKIALWVYFEPDSFRRANQFVEVRVRGAAVLFSFAESRIRSGIDPFRYLSGALWRSQPSPPSRVYVLFLHVSQTAYSHAARTRTVQVEPTNKRILQDLSKKRKIVVAFNLTGGTMPRILSDFWHRDDRTCRSFIDRP